MWVSGEEDAGQFRPHPSKRLSDVHVLHWFPGAAIRNTITEWFRMTGVCPLAAQEVRGLTPRRPFPASSCPSLPAAPRGPLPAARHFSPACSSPSVIPPCLSVC